MKLFKKILWLGVSSTLAFGFGTIAACGGNGDDSTGSSGEGDSSYLYRVSLQNETGFGFAGATVNLMKDDEVVASKTTNRSGNANFLATDVAEGKYTISIEGAPQGYAFTDPDRTYETGSKGTETVVSITPTGILEGAAPTGTFYKLGDIVHDFTVALPNGENYNLKEELQTKDLVLLNFWATWCNPCKSEFPAMHNAAIEYKDSVSVIAVSTTDTQAGVEEFQATNGYTHFNMAASGADKLTSYFGVSGIPHSVMIDRYGVVVFNEIGSMPSASAFTTKFERFVGDDYLPTVIGSAESDELPELPEEERMEPNVAAPNVSDVKNALTKESVFSFRFQEEEGLQPDEEGYDKYNWPWLIDKDKGYVYASNVNINNSYAILYSTMTAKEGDVLVFDYKIGSEQDCDILYIMLDGVIINRFSGNHADKWQTSYSYVFRDYEAGKHELAFVFMKDSATMAYEDVAQIKNLRLDNVADLTDSTEEINVFRQAATNPDKGEDAVKQFKNYVDVVLNPADEYYHVGTVDGPILYANMMNASAWNQNALWSLAYSNYIVGDGMNFREAIEDFAWEAAQVTEVNGYTPVTEDLRYLLDAAVRYVSFGEKFAGKYQDEMEEKDYHNQEWLELCVYWEHYGESPMPKDPMSGITFTAAIELKEGTAESPVANKVSVPYKINPRGFKYKFSPETSGPYKVYSKGEKDSVVFLVAEDRTTQLGYFDNSIFADESDDNFEFYWYFEAGKTYYMLFTTYLDELGSYDVYIDRLPDPYTYKENAAVGPYSANLNTFELFLPDAIAYGKDDDGNYRYKNEDGTLGGLIYLDLLRTTPFFNSASLYDICLNAIEKFPDETKRALYVEEQYIDGKYIEAHDYTADLWPLCRAADELEQPFIVVDENIYNILWTITRSAKYEGIEDSWLLLCYYDRTLAPQQ